MKTVDYLIVGQGIAGTSIAQRLQDANQSFIIIDEKRPNQSSRVASGMWNPLVFKRFTKVWLADEMATAFDSFFNDVEHRYGVQVKGTQHVMRLFANPKEIDEWLSVCDNPAFNGYLDEEIIRKLPYGLLPKEGMGCVIKSGRIDTGKWLDAARTYFLQNEMLHEVAFDFSHLILTESGVSYHNISAGRVIFCEGMYTVTQNPFFKHLPFKLTKGEVLTIHCPGLNLNNTLSGGISIIPLGNDTYKLAATYDWDNLNFEKTLLAHDYLVESAKNILGLPFTVVDHEVGIRPTVKDRRALLGVHPEHEQLFIFNGLGTRGVLMAPFLSAELIKFLIGGEEIHPEANISRFAKKG